MSYGRASDREPLRRDSRHRPDSDGSAAIRGVGCDASTAFFAYHVIAVPLALLALRCAAFARAHEVVEQTRRGRDQEGARSFTGRPLDGIPFPLLPVKDTSVWSSSSLFDRRVLRTEAGGYFSANNFIPADPEDSAAHRAGVVLHALLLDSARHYGKFVLWVLLRGRRLALLVIGESRAHTRIAVGVTTLCWLGL